MRKLPKLVHQACVGHWSNSATNKYPMSTSASVGETLTHQKKLRGLHVSAETAASLSLPRDFDGTRVELWKDLSFQLKAYLEMLEPDFVCCMNFATSPREPIADEKFCVRTRRNTARRRKTCQNVSATQVLAHQTLQRASTKDHSASRHSEWF